jgi:uncharacterized membrane protein YiaA
MIGGPAAMNYLLFDIFLSFIIGVLGANRKLGFWGYFFSSLLLTPFVGVILLCASTKKIPRKYGADSR